MQVNDISQSLLDEIEQYLERNRNQPRVRTQRPLQPETRTTSLSSSAPVASAPPTLSHEDWRVQSLQEELELERDLRTAAEQELQLERDPRTSAEQELQLERDLRTAAESARAASEAEASRIRSQGALLLLFVQSQFGCCDRVVDRSSS